MMTDHPTVNPGYPVYIYQEGVELPKEGVYFLVSGNGLWLHKDISTLRGFVPVENISVLQELDASSWVESKLPKLPAELTAQIKEFFRQVVEKYHSEANVLVYYREGYGFRLRVPEQRASHGGVHYERKGMVWIDDVEYLLVGTIHSHCDFGAFHSSTDIGDEDTFDGMHCTFGHNDKDQFTISASMVVNGHRIKVDPLTLLEGVESVQQSALAKVFSSKHGDYFQLSGDHEVDAELINSWLKNVKTWGISQMSKPKTFEKGDWVVWRGDMTLTTFREQCGDGPFEIHAAEKDMLVITTPTLGLAKFSDKLFKHAELDDFSNGYITPERVEEIEEIIQSDILKTETGNEENKED